jgi:hypothetical protein
MIMLSQATTRRQIVSGRIRLSTQTIRYDHPKSGNDRVSVGLFRVKLLE